MSHSVLGNINLARKIGTFLPLEELPNVCKTNKSLRRLTQTPEVAFQTLRAMLRSVTSFDTYTRFYAQRISQNNPDLARPLNLIRQMPALRQLKVTTSDGRFFLIGLERIPHARNLTSLDLTYRDSFGEVEFSALAKYQQLQRIRIDFPAINADTIDALIQIPTLTEVALLNFAIDSLGRLLEQLPNLRALTLAYGQPDPGRTGAARALASYGQNLTSISLHGNMDDPITITRMIYSCPKLTFLDVTGARFATRWTGPDDDGYDVAWYEVLERLAKERPKLVIKGPPRD